MQRLIKDRDFLNELSFTFERSQGPGGQHVNKVSTKVTLKFDVNASKILGPEEKELILKREGNRINALGILKLSSQEYRSQAANKRAVIKKFFEVLEHATRVPRKRKPTRISKAVKEKRLASKKRRSQIKSFRRNLDLRDD